MPQMKGMGKGRKEKGGKEGRRGRRLCRTGRGEGDVGNGGTGKGGDAVFATLDGGSLTLPLWKGSGGKGKRGEEGKGEQGRKGGEEDMEGRWEDGWRGVSSISGKGHRLCRNLAQS